MTFRNAKSLAVTYIESQLSQQTADPYSLSIICYALTLANSSKADLALQLLNSLAITGGKSKRTKWCSQIV